MPKCIYCQRNKSEFNMREHVIPQAFGRFQPINFILNDKKNGDKKVCNDCNTKFGKELEEILACESYEGYILRPKFQGNAPREKIRRNIIIRASEGEYHGVYFKLTEESKIDPLPQIGLKRNDGCWDYFLIENIKKIKKDDYDLTENSLRSICLNYEDARAIFSEINVKFERKGNLSKPIEKSILCEIEYSINKIIRRAITKIAFNYFAYFNFKYIVMDKAFDLIRNYILRGTGNSDDLIKITTEPILSDEQDNIRKLGHIITINKNDRGCLLAQISLFNYMKYTILLSKSFYPKKLEIGFGHFFDISTGDILKVERSRLIIPKFKILVPNPKIWTPKN